MNNSFQKNTGKVIEFPKDRITPFYKPRPGEGVANTKQRIFQSTPIKENNFVFRFHFKIIDRTGYPYQGVMKSLPLGVPEHDKIEKVVIIHMIVKFSG